MLKIEEEWRWKVLAKLIACRDYSSKKDKGKNIVGYKINLTKTGIDSTGIKQDDELQIEYHPNRIIITKK